MNNTPLIFISYSTKHTPLMDFFRTLIQDIGFRAEAFDFPSSKTVLDKQNELIDSCDGFLAILTPDQKLDDGSFICSSAVSTEVGAAINAGKPIQQFAFNGVDFMANQGSQANTVAKIDTLHRSLTGQLAFDDENVRQIIRALLEFKQRIESVIDASRSGNDDSYFSYRKFAVRQDIISDSELRLHNEIEAIALKTIKTHTHDAILWCDRSKGDGVMLDDDHFQFKLFRPADTTFKIRKTVNDHSTYRFSIDFDTPLQAGTELTYAYRRNHFNYLPFTLEELDSLISKGKVRNQVMAEKRMIGQDLFITQPTDSIVISMTFPAGYPIRIYEALVCEIRGEQIHSVETERAKDYVQLDRDQFDDVYTLQMEIPHPRINCTYFLLYMPPAEREIAHLTEEQQPQ